MNKKKALTLVAALTLVGVVGVGATLAYFTDSAAKTNVITMGNVDVDLEEPNFDPDDEDDKIEDVLPNQKIEKDPTITVKEGSADAYIRAKIELTGLTDKQQEELLAGINIKAGWNLSTDGYWYYNDVVTSATKSERMYLDEDGKIATDENGTPLTEKVDGVVLFDIVTIPEKWGNEVADLTFNIVVSAEAIQADNFTPGTDEKTGVINAWTYADGTEITAETYTVKGEVTEETPAEDADASTDTTTEAE